MIRINGTGYGPHDPVPWDDAIEQGGFYFDRARWLGLPCPPAILFDQTAPGYLDAIAGYHAMFKAAEAQVVARIAITWD